MIPDIPGIFHWIIDSENSTIKIMIVYLNENEKLLEESDKIIKQYIKDGIVETISINEIASEPGTTYHLDYRAVVL